MGTSMPAQRREPPEPVLEWVMLFPNGHPASAVLRTSDMKEVHEWASHWPAGFILNRRIVLEGHWFPHDEVVPVDLRRMKRRQCLVNLRRREAT